jgi:hypothetical protein
MPNLAGMRRLISGAATFALTFLTVAGCGGVNIDVSGFKAPHDHATFIFNGEQTTIAMSGSVSVQIDGVPELSYSGPVGCAGHYFVDDESDLYFRYTAHKAYLLRYDQLYTFIGPPQKGGQDIIWNHTFGPDKITVLANCPLPSGA